MVKVIPKLSGAIAFCAAVVFAPQASACKCAGQLGAIQGGIAGVNASVLSLHYTLMKAAGQISGNIEVSNRSLAKLIDTGHQRTVERQRQQISGKSAQDFAPSAQACNTVTGVSTLAAVVANALASANQQAMLSTRWNDGSRAGGATTRADATKVVVDRMRGRYCSTRERELGLCSVPETYEGAMLRPLNVLLTPSTYLDQRSADAARDAALLLTNPLPAPAPPKDWYSADTAGNDIRRQMALSLIGFGQGVIQSAIADRDSIKDPNYAAYVAGWIKAVNPSSTSTVDVSSKRALVQAEVERRHASTAWQASLYDMGQVELIRESTRLQALNAHLNFNVMERLERLEVMQGLQISDRGRQLQDQLFETRDGGQGDRAPQTRSGVGYTVTPAR